MERRERAVWRPETPAPRMRMCFFSCATMCVFALKYGLEGCIELELLDEQVVD